MKVETTRSMRATLRPDGIIEVVTRNDWDQPDTVESATENALTLQQLVDKQPRALLTILPNMHVNKEILAVYNNIEIGQVADAMLVDSFGAKVLGNLALSVRRTKHPARIFTKKTEAETWLLKIIAKA